MVKSTGIFDANKSRPGIFIGIAPLKESALRMEIRILSCFLSLYLGEFKSLSSSSDLDLFTNRPLGATLNQEYRMDISLSGSSDTSYLSGTKLFGTQVSYCPQIPFPEKQNESFLPNRSFSVPGTVSTGNINTYV